MNVTIARSSGFCFGVKNAVTAAEEAVAAKADGRKLVMLGEIVHNRYVVDKLLAGGFVICETAEEVPENSIVIIRAHGVTPEEIAVSIAGELILIRAERRETISDPGRHCPMN